jgi:hypothetical protein
MTTARCLLLAASCISLCLLPNPHSAFRNPHSTISHPQSAIRIPHSAIPPWGWLGFCTSKKLQKLRINPQTRLKDISFKFMYVTVLLIKIMGYSFL